jgi:hypothetical protein
MKIITNNQPRPVIWAIELSEKEREEFNYVDWEAVKRGEDSRDFVRYKGELYDLDDMEGCPPEVFDQEGWHAWLSDSFYSGILVKYLGPDFDHVIMGRYYS